MTPDRESRVEQICHEALALDAAAREAFVADACAGDHALRREVESLLAQQSKADGFLSTPALIGRKLGAYQIQSLLGAGGMGEVYRARDTKLGRDVAIKILPRLFATDPDRLARFEREARMLASLNHPNVGAIYGVEDANGIPALVLELIEGPTLADRLGKGPLPLRDALTIATQTALALEAAHERGIVHRDLKPANIKLRRDGTVKVLDFGLAKAVGSNASGPDLSQSPTITAGGTKDGVILGTAAYMSPEQAQGQAANARSDIWAFGVVLYEMLAGRPGFRGKTTLEVLSNVLKGEPDWAALPAATPLVLQSLLRRCLQKEPTRRLRDIADARLQIEEVLNGPGDDSAVSTLAPARPTRERLIWVAGLVVIAAGAAGLVRYAGGRPVQADEVRLEVNAPPTTDATSFAISPDGKTLVFAATSDGVSRLWLRPLNGLSARPLIGTDNARFPFWSPDGRSVGFSASAQLKRVDVDSGSVRVLFAGWALGGGSWATDGTILFDPGPGAALVRVSADGGTPTEVTRKSQEVDDASSPQFLPDQRHFLFCATGGVPGIYIGQLGGPEAARRIVDAQAATYTAGNLLFVQQGTLLAQAFDDDRLELAGSPTVVAEHVVVGHGPCEAALSASAAGPVVYRTGAAPSQFAWFDRSGKVLETIAGSGIGDGYNSSMSPDGRRLALASFGGGTGGTTDLWLLDLSRGVPTRFTVDPAFELMPVWSPDGKRLAFTSNRAQANGSTRMSVYVRPVTGVGDDELLVATDNANNNPSDWSPDGRFILFVRCGSSGCDLWALPMDGDRRAFPVVQAAGFSASNALFSPDGKWIAYQSNKSGQYEIYVQPFLGRGHETRISGDGGIQARWRHDGKEIFYLASDNRLMAAPIQLDASTGDVKVGTPVSLFTPHLSGTPRNYMGRHYMVSPDGQRFLMETPKEVTLPITVILNWRRKP